MKKIKAKINFKDKRGVISDLIEREKIDAITYSVNKTWLDNNNLNDEEEDDEEQ